jgi:poly-beta-1,6-N-acetyl-D-glucosamine synthase
VAACFWGALAFVAYTYVGYPLIVGLLARLRPNELAEPSTVREWPRVCILIAVHNEAHRLLPKIENLRQLDYPPQAVRILFVSDGSSDDTNARLAATPGVEYAIVPERRGKAHALNVGMQRVHEDVVVFTDVRQMLVPAAIKHLIATLMQPGIGAVSGELVHRDAATRQAARIGLYWRYEKVIRKAESRLHSTAGVTGALYAMRAGDVVRLPEDALLDDFEMPIAVLRKGLRVLFEPRAVMYDELQPESAGERRRKIRTLAGNYQSFARNPWLFAPWRNPIWWQFLSHKAFRLLVPYALPIVLATSWLLGGAYRAFGLLQLAGYGLALLGLASKPLREQRLISFIVVFVELNWAAVLGLRQYLGGRLSAQWEKT